MRAGTRATCSTAMRWDSSRPMAPPTRTIGVGLVQRQGSILVGFNFWVYQYWVARRLGPLGWVKISKLCVNRDSVVFVSVNAQCQCASIAKDNTVLGQLVELLRNGTFNG